MRHFGRGDCSAKGAARIKGGYSLSSEREYPPLHPPRERDLIGSLGLEGAFCLRNATACVAVLLTLTAIGSAIRLASASIIRCRSAHLVEVQPNHRLSPVPTMRRAKQCRYFARSLPPSKRHSRLTIVRRGCKRSRIAGIHGEAMYTAPDSAGRAALQATSYQCRRSRGSAPCVLLGV